MQTIATRKNRHGGFDLSENASGDLKLRVWTVNGFGIITSGPAVTLQPEWLDYLAERIAIYLQSQREFDDELQVLLEGEA